MMNWMNRKSFSFSQLSIFLYAPAKPGVCLLHNLSRCIYVGATDNIRQSLLGHIKARESWIAVFDPRAFSYELCSEVSSVQRKNELVAILGPVIEFPNGDTDRAAPESAPDATEIRLARF